MRCPLCLAALVMPGRVLLRCERCRTDAHADCARELNGGRCGVHGCERGLAVVARGAVVGGEAQGAGTSRWSRRRAAALFALAAALIAVALVSLPTPHAVSDTCFCGLAHDEVITVKITDEIR